MEQKGSCHCGKVQFTVDAEIDGALSCNCSICIRKGTLLHFVPAEKFKLISGESSLTDYQFGRKTIHHYFCSTCGVTSFAAGTAPDGKEMRAVNVRCLDGINVGGLKIKQFDGRSL